MQRLVGSCRGRGDIRGEIDNRQICVRRVSDATTGDERGVGLEGLNEVLGQGRGCFDNRQGLGRDREVVLARLWARVGGRHRVLGDWNIGRGRGAELRAEIDKARGGRRLPERSGRFLVRAVGLRGGGLCRLDRILGLRTLVRGLGGREFRGRNDVGGRTGLVGDLECLRDLGDFLIVLWDDDRVFRALVKLSEAPDGRQVVRGPLEHLLERCLRLVVSAEIEQRPSERHTGREMIRKLLQAVLAEGHRTLEVTRTPESLGNAAKRRSFVGGHLPAAFEGN